VLIVFRGPEESIIIASNTGQYLTMPLKLDDVSDVFFGSPKPHVVVGKPEFVEGQGARVVSRLENRSLTYHRIASALADPRVKPSKFDGWRIDEGDQYEPLPDGEIGSMHF
jgi:hypothetical protein